MNKLGKGRLAHARGFFYPVKEKPELAEKLDAIEAAEDAEHTESADREVELTD
jgi:hypothetical protein